MVPIIDKKGTGIQLRKFMDERRFAVKDIQKYLGLGSVQSVYHWLNGISLPTLDNLYALSELFNVSVDEMLCGNRRYVPGKSVYPGVGRFYAYYRKINEHKAA